MPSMNATEVQVAILLATYNGAQYVEQQIKSLKENTTPFVLHWLDDHSTDNTRNIVRTSAASAGIQLLEWHQPGHLGVPSTFLRLLDCVEADVYLFCDQDDIWQPGKIDATVRDLLPDLESPSLCYSIPLVFDDKKPEDLRHFHDVVGVRTADILQASRLFMSTPACGNTMAFTRPLRELYLRHKDVARDHAIQHDWWLYIIAHACGAPRMLTNIPTALYRRHEKNFTVRGYEAGVAGVRGILTMWEEQRWHRLAFVRQAEGFIRASNTLPAGAKLDYLLKLANRVAQLNRRQSLREIISLYRDKVMNPARYFTLALATACLFMDAECDLETSTSDSDGVGRRSRSYAR